MKLLALDTATENCSAALVIDGRLLEREIESERGHAELILPMIDGLLAEAGVSLAALDGIAFGRGPGSFTGVRIAASVAQGLAFGAGLGVVPVSDLRAVAQRALELDPAVAHVLVCNDARMREVYWACFERRESRAEPAGPERVDPPQGVRPARADMVGAGRGFAAHPQLSALTGAHLPAGWDRLLPRAADIARLAEPEVRLGRLLAPEAAVPVYVRDQVARPSSI